MHRGTYADPAIVDEFLERAKDFGKDLNVQWLKDNPDYVQTYPDPPDISHLVRRNLARAMAPFLWHGDYS